jgi:hypothetical protein
VPSLCARCSTVPGTSDRCKGSLLETTGGDDPRAGVEPDAFVTRVRGQHHAQMLDRASKRLLVMHGSTDPQLAMSASLSTEDLIPTHHPIRKIPSSN